MKHFIVMKKVVSIMLCVLMLFSAIPQLSFTANAATLTDDFSTYSEVPIADTATSEKPYKVYEGASASNWSLDTVGEALTGPTGKYTTVLINDLWGDISGDTTVSVDGKFTTDIYGSYVGVIARYGMSDTLGKNCYYRAYLNRKKANEATLYVERRNGGTSVGTVSVAGIPITKGETYIVKMDVIDNDDGSVSITAYVNGVKKLDTFKDTTDTLKTGKTGIFVYNPGTETISTTQFDNFTVVTNTASIPAPAGLTATLSGNQADLSWSAVSGASGYNVYKKEGSGSYTQIASALATTSYTDTGLQDGLTYSYAVRAVDSGAQETSDSNVASVTLKPVAPNGLTAVPGDNSVSISWNAVTGASSYNVYRSESAGATGTTVNAAPVNDVTFTDSTALNGTTYYYTVTAHNTAGDSTVSNEASATPVAPAVAPAAPTGVTTIAQEDEVTISWAPVSNASSYTVKKSTVSGGPYTVLQSGITDTSKIDSGLSEGKYFYVVSATNSAGEGADSAEVSADIVLPSAPAELTATSPSTGKVNLTWNYSGVAQSYNVYQISNNGTTYTKVNSSPITTKNYSVTGLTDGTEYSFVVTTLNKVGESPYSLSVSATPQPAPANTINVTSSDFASKLSSAPDGSTLLLATGSYPSFSMADKSDITIKAAEGAKPIFNSGNSIYIKRCSNIILQGLEFSMSVGGGSYWIKVTNSNHVQIKENHFTSPATAGTGSTWVFIGGGDGDSISHDNYIGYNIMENKNDTGKFIILDGAGNPKIPTQNDIIEHNEFKNTLGRQANESEPIRLGVSDLVTYDAFSIVQYNTFYHADSDPEIVSVKSCSNTIRYNKFIECLGTVCIRQSFNTEVYGNYFLGNGRTDVDSNGGFLGTGGVRIYSNGHKVYNNYFENLTGTKWDAAITMTDGDAVNPENSMGQQLTSHYPAKNVIVANNTFVNNKHNFEIGFRNATGDNQLSKPITNVTIANNVVVASENEIFNIMDQPDNLTLSGNIMFTQGSAKLYTTIESESFWSSLAEAQVKNVDPMLIKVGDYYKLSKNSPAVNAAIGDYSLTGTLGFINKDIDGEARVVGLVDVGADEYVESGEADTTSPTWNDANPLSVDTSTTTSSSVQISWTPANDDKGISGYKIYKNGSLYATALSSVNTFKIIGLEPTTTYTFKVVAVDTSGNLSADSNTVTETTSIKVEPVITSIKISGLSQMLVSSSPAQIVVTANYNDDTSKDITSISTFSSNNPQVAQISSTGLVTAVGTGITVINATCGSLTDTYILVVTGAVTTTITATDDAYVQANPISDTTLMWIKNNAGTEFRDGFIKFDLSSISGEVANGILKVGVSAIDSNTTSCDFQIYGLNDDSWTESTVTYTNQPTDTGTLLGSGTVTASNVGSYIEFNITDFIKAQTDGKISFRIRGVTRSKGFKLATKEYNSGSLAPTLVVSTSQDTPVTGIALDRSNASMKVNETLELHATVIPDSANITWSVLENKTQIVTVDQSGNVLAKGEGSAVVRASVSEAVYADCTINVAGRMNAVPVAGITLDKTTAELKVNETLDLHATVIPLNATSKSIIWSVLDNKNNIVTVDQVGHVIAVGEGTAKVRATVTDTVYNAVYNADCVITVSGILVRVPVTGISVSTDRKIKIGESFKIAATVLPANATNKNVRYELDKAGIVTVDSEGNVKGVGLGTVEITVISLDDETITAKMKVVVSSSGHSGSVYVPAETNSRNEVSNSQFDNAVKNATVGEDGIKSLKFEVKEKTGAKAYELVLPSNAISQTVVEHQIEIKTPIGTAILPGNMLNPQQTADTQNILFTMEIVNKNSIADEKVKEIVGDRPVVDISLKSNKETLSYNNPDAPVVISIPYTPTAEELNNIEHIVVYYIGNDGKIVKVPNAKYNASTGMVTFKTTHFSKYAISFDNVTFSDLDSFAWAKNQIEVLAAKGILNGTGNNKFSPEEKVTRADFMVMLVKTLGLTADYTDNFSDVKNDTYYYEALGIAKKLGITQGTGSNLFKPEEEISRQDMMVLCARALKAYNIIKTSGSPSELSKFIDNSTVADYAKTEIATMVKEGIVTGDGDTLNPLGNATRAETAVIMYRIFNKL